MPQIILQSDDAQDQIRLAFPQAWTTCLITALMAALPHFLDAFVKCLTNSGDPDKFNPGDRQRCP